MLKKGISAVVATVLMILITIASISIVWVGFLPIFADMDSEVYSDLNFDVVLEGYTVYDPAENFAFVQVERGQDETEVVALEVIFYFNGTSYNYLREDVPFANEKKTYAFNFTRDGLFGVPEKVSIAPVMRIGDTRKFGKIVSEKLIPVSKVALKEEEWEDADEDSKESKIKISSGGYVKSRDFLSASVIEVDSCINITEPGEYLLTKDIYTSGATCIMINSSDVVFDGDGHLINYTDPVFSGSYPFFGNEGILVTGSNPPSKFGEGRRNIEIKDVVVRGTYHGIKLFLVNDSSLENIEASFNEYNGISIYDSYNNVVKNSNLSFNEYSGISVSEDTYYSNKTSIIDNLVSFNGDYGVMISSPEVFVEDNSILNNTRGGIGYRGFRFSLTDSRFNDNVICGLSTEYDFMCLSVGENEASGNTYGSQSGCGWLDASVGSC